MTRKSVQNQLEQKHGIRYDSKTDLTQSLADRKGEIKLAINDFLLLSNVISNSQKAKEQVWKGVVVISRIRGTIIHRILMCLDVAVQMNVFYLFSCLPEGSKTEENCSLDEEERREVDLLFANTPSASQTQNPAALPSETSDNQTERQGYVPDADLAAIVGNEEQFRYQVCNGCAISSR